MRKIILIAFILIVIILGVYMAEEKVYTPATIQDNPFPGETETTPSSSTSSTSQTYTPKTINDNSVPKPIIAQETIGQALNTKSKKILGEFTLSESGAISIGKYTNGISGDIRVTPNGIVARDLSGNTTFALDGDNGSATFKGTVQANDFVVADENGLVSLNAFSVQTSTITSGQTTTANALELDSWGDISGAAITLTPTRTTYYLVGFSMNVKNSASEDGDLAFIRFLLDSSVVGPQLLEAGNWVTGSVGYQTVSTTFIISVEKGNHIIKAQWGTSGGGTTSNFSDYPYNNQLYAIKLGS